MRNMTCGSECAAYGYFSREGECNHCHRQLSGKCLYSDDSVACLRRNNLDRVAVPEYMWSAYCCVEFNQNAPYFVRYKFPVFAAYGRNDRVDNHVVEVPLKKLEKFLKGEDGCG